MDKKMINRRNVVCVILLSIVFISVFIAIGVSMQSRYINLTPDVESSEIDSVTMVYRIKLPDTYQELENIVFTSNGNVVQVRSGGKLIYEYGIESIRKGDMVGSVSVNLPLPEEAYGQPLTVTLISEDRNSSPELGRVELVPNSLSLQYYVSTGMISLVVMWLFLAIAAFLIPLYVFSGTDLFEGFRTLCLVGSIISVVFLMISGGGRYMLFSDQHLLWSKLRYLAKYLLPMFMLWFFMTLEKSKIQRRILIISASVNTAFALVVSLIGFLDLIPFCNMDLAYTILLLGDVGVAVYGIIYNLKMKTSQEVRNSQVFLLIPIAILALFILVLSVLNVSAIRGIYYSDSLKTVAYSALLAEICYLYLSDYGDTMRERQKELRDTEEELKNSEIRIMVNQMQPHFMYNSLTAIRVIILDNPKYAYDLLYDFTAYLRGNIRALTSDKPIPFSEELENTRSYLNIEQMRIGDRLNIEYDIRCTDFNIIPLTIQPLAENSARHGILPKKEGGTIVIRSYETNEDHVIEVEDDGVGFSVDEVMERDGDSVGMKNLMFRLKTKMNAKIEIVSEIGKGTCTKVMIPKGELKK